ncbi:MAG: Gfo/Idh/MocA family protein [Saccharofermentanales bacterium]
MKKLKYGIIGTGGISEKHLPGYSLLKDEVELYAACDIDYEKMRKQAEKYSIPNMTTDYHELLSMDEIDFVSICLPNYLHAQVTIEALKKGKHVHCEKPMAMNYQEAKQMLDAKIDSDRKLMIGLNNRFTHQSMYAKNYIDEGNLGEIYYAKCGWLRRGGLAASGWFTDKALSGGGPLIDLGVHFIDLVMYFLGYPQIDSVLAKTYRKFTDSDIRKIYTIPGLKYDAEAVNNVEDLATGFINLKNDISVSFEVSWASNTVKEKYFYEIYGTKSGISYDSSTNETSIITVVNGHPAEIRPLINPALYEETEFKHFVNCIKNNQEPTISIPEQCVEMMKLIDGIYRSAQSGKQYFYDI